MKKLNKLITGIMLTAILLSLTSGIAFAANAESSAVVSDIADIAYTDIKNSWYSASAEKYGYPEIFGNPEHKFYPEKKITRMEFARLLHKALNININYFAATDIAEYFDDVKNEDTGASALYDLVTAGIIDKKGSFNPDKQLDRDEMIHYIIKALDYVTGGEYAMIMLMPAPFDDDSSISEEYKNDVIKAVIMNLIKGVGSNRLEPKRGAVRAEAVTVVDRLVQLTKSLKREVVVSAAAEETKDGLKMSLIIQNNSDKEIIIEHTSGQQFDFKLLDFTGESLYTWSADKLFMAALTTTKIKAGEEVIFSDILHMDAYEPIKNKVDVMKAYIVGTSEDFTIDTDGYSAVIS